MPTECNLTLFGFARVEGHSVVASFGGGRMPKTRFADNSSDISARRRRRRIEIDHWATPLPIL